MTTQWKTKIKTALIGILLPACLCLLNPLFAAEALIDSNFSDQLNAEGWPDGWPNTKEASLQEENGNAFLRLESQESGSMVMLYREIHLPEGTEALEFTFKERVSNLKRGSNSWYDARIMMEFMDADRSRVSPNPPTPNRSKNTDGWQVRELKFNVPENARILKFMPSLFRVESGTYDLDDVVLRPIPELAPEDDPAFQRRLKQQQAMNARREKAGQLLEEHGDIFPNGDFERDSNGDGSPDHWGGGTYVKEDGNTFMRINAKPD
jgi:endoglucanase